jgi:hypothetical protein
VRSARTYRQVSEETGVPLDTLGSALESMGFAWMAPDEPIREDELEVVPFASSSNDPTNQEAISKRRDQGGHETSRQVAQRELPGQVRLLDGVGCMDGLSHAGWAGR